MISNCGHDERNKYTGGKAGDQTSTEWVITAWYDRPWNCVLRYPYDNIREELGDMAEKAARNNHVGYDMWQRKTYWEQLQKVGYDPARITTDCEADCSSGVTANAKALGFIHNIQALKDIPEDTYTENMMANFRKAGFEVLTDKKYTKSQDYLLRGDILLNHKKHVTTNLTDGKFAKIQNENTLSVDEVAKLVISGKYGNDPERSAKLSAEGYDPKVVQAKVNEIFGIKKPTEPVKKTATYKVVNVSSFLNVRSSPNGPIIGKLYNGNTVEVVYIEKKWAKLDNGGFVFTDYIKKV